MPKAELISFLPIMFLFCCSLKSSNGFTSHSVVSKQKPKSHSWIFFLCHIQIIPKSLLPLLCVFLPLLPCFSAALSLVEAANISADDSLLTDQQTPAFIHFCLIPLL
jgi:hypothetical protein